VQVTSAVIDRKRFAFELAEADPAGDVLDALTELLIDAERADEQQSGVEDYSDAE
jgi:hypothetical protein